MANLSFICQIQDKPAPPDCQLLYQEADQDPKTIWPEHGCEVQEWIWPGVHRHMSFAVFSANESISQGSLASARAAICRSHTSRHVRPSFPCSNGGGFARAARFSAAIEPEASFPPALPPLGERVFVCLVSRVSVHGPGFARGFRFAAERTTTGMEPVRRAVCT
jgi:hypothetical protein